MRSRRAGRAGTADRTHPPAEGRALTIRVRWTGLLVRADDGVLLDVPRLELEGPGLVLLLGATGSGKSTLLKAVTGILPTLTGLALDGTLEFEPSPPRIGYVPQDALDGFLSFDAEHEFLLRARARGLPLDAARLEAEGRVASVGLADRATLPIVRLSAGERRRLALAAAETHEPSLLLLDEPFDGLDTEWRTRFYDAVARASRRRLVLAATHDPRPLLPMARRAIVLAGGRPVFDGPPDELLARADEFPDVRLAPDLARPARPAPEGPILVELSHVDAERGGQAVLADVNLELGPGFHAILGPNGSGKTTLLRLLVGLDAPVRGHVRVAGVEPHRVGPAAMSRRVTLHFEDPTAAFFAPTVEDEIAFAPTNHGADACDVEARLREALADFDLEALRGRPPRALSGGQQERLALACAAAAATRVVLLDEPTHGLDATGRRILHAFVDRLATRACVLVATHDEELAARAHSVHALEGGRTRAVPREVAPRTRS